MNGREEIVSAVTRLSSNICLSSRYRFQAYRFQEFGSFDP
jgi:hypothetical protein